MQRSPVDAIGRAVNAAAAGTGARERIIVGAADRIAVLRVQHANPVELDLGRDARLLALPGVPRLFVNMMRPLVPAAQQVLASVQAMPR